MEIRAMLPEVYPALWRYCVVLSASRVEADDLAQRTCLRALDRAAQFQSGTSLRAWLFTIARNLWANELKSWKVRTGNGVVDAGEFPLVSDCPEAETNIFVTEVLNRISLLPEAQREAVILVYAEGFSYRDAAEMMDCPIGTVMSRLAAARRTLSSAFSEDET